MLLLKGTATFVPGYLGFHAKYRAQPPGGAVTAEYCYSVWLRHLIHAAESGLNASPEAVGELGPGASLGVGICALLTGASAYYAVDASHYANREISLRLLPELVDLLKTRAPIPGQGRHKPALASSDFPSHILTGERLSASLGPDRIDAIGRAVVHGQADGLSVRYFAPWDDPSIVPAESLDMILSQAVLEHIERIGPIYSAMYRWLRPGGFMSHQIDYKSHGMASTWDGHWTHSDLTWTLLNGRRPKAINRLPHSSHIGQLQRAGFTLSREMKVESERNISPRQLAPRFCHLSQSDLKCSGAFIQARK
ncbi:methyltransferase domain-containing protein [Methylosinus sp. PW1]|uniref:methyltransferase domain-containing protein n=1 Tax=Methylosinus sp. PW1 TaxID=107636 RepID=UPI0018DE9568|nr:methyltransferase domain-containing protein [Methylosinus sp. PW1]